MAIQFSCSQCHQPIEVDDAHAGQTAACPYCRHVVTVPVQSTFQADAAVPARPTEIGAGGAGAAPSGGAYSGLPGMEPLATRYAGAYALGRNALICSIIGILLLAVGIAINIKSLGGIPSAMDTKSAEEMLKHQEKSPLAVWGAVVQMGSLAVSVLGLVLAIVSLYQVRQGNGRAWAALVLSGLPLFCLCAGTVMWMLMMAAGGGLPGA